MLIFKIEPLLKIHLSNPESSIITILEILDFMWEFH
jgi:hypothetical protein